MALGCAGYSAIASDDQHVDVIIKTNNGDIIKQTCNNGVQYQSGPVLAIGSKDKEGHKILIYSVNCGKA
jgi:hypothetical protein